MNALTRWARAIWEFVVGDDPLIAVAVAIAVGLTAVIAAAGVAAWWVLPVAVVAVLAVSMRRAG